MATPGEATFELPFELVKNSGGFSMDMGGSVAKVIYRDKRDWDFGKNEPKKINGHFAHLRSFMFAREKRKDVVAYIKEHCHITQKTDSQTLIYTTGIGSNEYGREFGSAFNVILKNLTEMDCFIKTFRYLCHNMPENKFLHEVPARPFEKIRLHVEHFQSMMEIMERDHLSAGKFEITNQSKEEQLKAAEFPKTPNLSKGIADSYAKQNQVFPCLVAMFGSGIGFMKVEEDGTFAVKDMSMRGGRSFLGLGSILTGATFPHEHFDDYHEWSVNCQLAAFNDEIILYTYKQSYEELMEMAEKGDQMKVHTYAQDFEVHRSEDEDMYAHMHELRDFPTFGFGKGVCKTIGDFTKEDLARGWLHYMCNDLAQMTNLIMKAYDIKTAFVCGNFGNSLLVRELFTEEFLFRTLFTGEVGQRHVRFVKGGGFLGAIGAYMEGYEI